MNKAMLIGNLASDPETSTTQSGISKCTFRLAVQRKFANQQGVKEADFLPIVCWRQTAELCARYLAKGRKVAVEGTIQTRSYDAQDGSKRYITEIVADNVEFLGSHANSHNDTKAPEPDENGYTPVSEDELPEFMRG